MSHIFESSLFSCARGNAQRGALFAVLLRWVVLVLVVFGSF